MDPISLVTLFGAGTLLGLGMQHQMDLNAVDDSVVLRKIFDTSDGWISTEIMSPEALNLTGEIMKVSMLPWWPKVKSGFYKVVTLTQPGAPLERQIVLLLESAGTYGWYLREAHHPNMRRVEGRLNYQRIQSLLNALNTDPAEEVVRRAAAMTNLQQRYAYLKKALTANPQLSALVAQSEPFLEITRATVKVVDPKQYAEVEARKARRRERRAISASEPVMRALPAPTPEVIIQEREAVLVER